FTKKGKWLACWIQMSRNFNKNMAHVLETDVQRIQKYGSRAGDKCPEIQKYGLRARDRCPENYRRGE
ncbi:5619_t:CDS:1, partial [Cetraspora pellucida]